MTSFHGQGNPVMEAAFYGCIKWAWSEPDMRKSFEEETGMKLPSSGLDALIDSASGYDEVLVERFVEWVTKNLWGSDD